MEHEHMQKTTTALPIDPKPPTQGGQITALLADDHPLIVEGLTSALARFGIRIVGQTGTAKEVIEKYLECRPDVVVLDVRFGDQETGLDVAKNLLTQYPVARIVFYSQFDQDEIISEAYRLGGAGFITKSKPPAVLANAIEIAARSKSPQFLSEIAERLALLGLRREVKNSGSPLENLDTRELEVFTKMAQGHTNVEIAEAMRLSPKTISMTSQCIKDKLGIHRAAEITLLAVKCGVVKP